MRKFCGVKATDIWFKNQYFTLSACCSYSCCIPCRMYYHGLVAGMGHLKHSSINSFNSIIYQPKKLAWVQWLNYKQYNSQLTILVTFFSNQKSLVIGVQAQSQPNFLLQLASSIVFIIIVINCEVAFKLYHHVLAIDKVVRQ